MGASQATHRDLVPPLSTHPTTMSPLSARLTRGELWSPDAPWLAHVGEPMNVPPAEKRCKKTPLPSPSSERHAMTNRPSGATATCGSVAVPFVTWTSPPSGTPSMSNRRT